MSKINIEYNVSNKDYNLKIVIIGLILLIFRLWFITALIQDDGSFHPEVFHTSYFISLLNCLALIFSFRVKPLNTISLTVLPSVFFTFIHDFPIWINPNSAGLGSGHEIGGLLWWNFITIHTPIPLIAFYIFITRKHTISRFSYLLNLWILISWFLFVDDKKNGTIDGRLYLIIGGIVLVVWTYIFLFIICKNTEDKSQFIAPILRIRKISFFNRILYYRKFDI